MSDDKIAPSAQFTNSARALGENLTCAIRLREARDEAEVMVGRLQGLLDAAKVELDVRQRAYGEGKALMAPQAELHLRVMEEEATENITALRARREAS